MTDAPRKEPPPDRRDALIREQAARIATLEAMVAELRERLEVAERAGPQRCPGRSRRRTQHRADAGKRASYPSLSASGWLSACRHA